MKVLELGRFSLSANWMAENELGAAMGGGEVVLEHCGLVNYTH